MNRVYLLLGSNMGDREATLNEANLELIDALLPDYLEVSSLDEAVDTSEMMETEPWGFSAPVDPFLNQSFRCLTELEPHEVLQVCQRIETELGRERKEPQFDADGKRIYESRPIDIDILAFERQEGEEWKEVTVNAKDLVIPHPQLQSRDFAVKLYKELKEKKKIEKTRNKKK